MPRREWCDIFVKYLEGQQGRVHQFTVSIRPTGGATSTSPQYVSQLRSQIGGLLQQFAASRPDIGYLKADITAIEDKSMAANAQKIAECVNSFMDKKPVHASADGFECSVGAESRWLEIRFYVSDRVYSILVAPT
jgi:hypothetical protein